MCSASSRITRSRMSRKTSTNNRSAPLPPRNTRIACSWSSAWVTEAPLSIAILVAVVSWPLRVPTIRRRIALSFQWLDRLRREARATASTAVRLDDFGHGHAELLLDQHDFAAGDQAIVDVDIDRFA